MERKGFFFNFKIRDECGYELHMIYNNLTYNDNFKQLFEKFDSHYFFK